MKIIINNKKNLGTVNVSQNGNIGTIKLGKVQRATTATQLGQLTDVDDSDADTGEVLVYDAANNNYVVQTIPNVNGGDF